MSEVKLLPCPFCGGPAERVDDDGVDETSPIAGGSYIACTVCDTSTAAHFGTKENLLDSWNRRHRAEPANIAELREVLWNADTGEWTFDGNCGIEIKAAGVVVAVATNHAFADLIADAVTSLPGLLDEIDRLKQAAAEPEVLS